VPARLKARTVAALFAGGRVIVDVHALGPKIWKFLIAGVLQEQCLASIADKHECAMRKMELVHSGLLLNLRRILNVLFPMILEPAR
jgi:hypothetical protein